MEEHTLSVGSVTYAMKAQTLLQRRGIPCRIVRNRSKGQGCGYQIVVQGDLPSILALLEAHHIRARKEGSL